MMRKSLLLIAPLALVVGCADDSMGPTEPAIEPVAQFASTANRGTNGALGVVYVTSQELYYDTFVSAQKLPMHGRFQKLDPVAGTTEWGPGQQGYVGGRWWIDNTEEGEVGVMDEADTFLLCPLLGPGRTSP